VLFAVAELLVFGLRVHLRGIRVKFIHEGRLVKVKVTALKHKIFYSRNVKLQSAVTPVQWKIAVQFECSMGFSATADRVM